MVMVMEGVVRIMMMVVMTTPIGWNWPGTRPLVASFSETRVTEPPWVMFVTNLVVFMMIMRRRRKMMKMMMRMVMKMVMKMRMVRVMMKRQD